MSMLLLMMECMLAGVYLVGSRHCGHYQLYCAVVNIIIVLITCSTVYVLVCLLFTGLLMIVFDVAGRSIATSLLSKLISIAY